MTEEKHKAELLELKQDLDFYREAIQEVASEVMKQDVSKYPIFIAHKEPINLGRPILKAEEFEAKWDISASLLEEFVAKDIIKENKVNDFREIFKDPEDHMCVFAVSRTGGQFVFFPYAGEEDDEKEA